MGDITITSNRAKYGDFTLPYMMTGVSMVVPIVNRNTKSLWWFLKPLTWKLWLVILVLSLSKGLLVWYFEHKNNPEFKGTFSERVGKTLAFSFSILVFAQKEKLKSNYLRLLLNLWIYEVFVLGTAYAAILQSTLSNNVQPTAMSMEQLIMNGDYVGYQKGSNVFDLLKHRGFQEQKLKPYSSIEEYAIALSRGSHNNGVSAIIDEIPYLKVFLAKYADQYTMAGPTFRPGGFGFLFRKGSSIVPDVSRAIQEFIDGEKMTELEKKWFDSHESNPTPTQTPQRDMILSTHDFLGVFLIAEPISVLTLLIFIISITCKYWKTKRGSASNRAVEASNTEELFLRFYIDMNGSHTNEYSHIVQGESAPATPK